MKYEYISMDTIEENNKLIFENENLKDEIKRLYNRLEDKFMSNYPLVVENGIIVKKNKEIAELLETIDMITNDASEYVKRIDEAIKYTNELIADTKGMLNDMKYQNKEETITRFVKDLEKDIKNYEYQISILRGEYNE